MIAVVSLNACLDKTFYVAGLQEGILRPQRTFVQAGGKGVNVARVLQRLGDEVSLFTMLAGQQGAHIAALLERDGFRYEAVKVSGQSRMYLTILSADNRQMAIKENGPQLSTGEAETVKEKFACFLERTKPEMLCVCDSIPCEALTEFYPFAVRAARDRGIRVFLDADGRALEEGLRERPDYIKPNLEEYAALTGEKPEGIVLSRALTRLRHMGISHPLVSLGEEGCAFLESGRVYRAVSRNTRCVSPVGCGDSFIAGIVHGVTHGKAFPDAVCLGTAAGSANAKRSDAANVGREEILREAENVSLEAAEEK